MVHCDSKATYFQHKTTVLHFVFLSKDTAYNLIKYLSRVWYFVRGIALYMQQTHTHSLDASTSLSKCHITLTWERMYCSMFIIVEHRIPSIIDHVIITLYPLGKQSRFWQSIPLCLKGNYSIPLEAIKVFHIVLYRIYIHASHLCSLSFIGIYTPRW